MLLLNLVNTDTVLCKEITFSPATDSAIKITSSKFCTPGAPSFSPFCISLILLQGLLEFGIKFKNGHKLSALSKR